MEIYQEMLRDFCQIPISKPDEPSPREGHPHQCKRRQRGQHLLGKMIIDDPDCCDEPEITHAPRGENAYCLNCGRCVKNRFLELDFTRLKTGVFFTKKRFYTPVTHFKEHMRRYMGGRFTDIPQTVIENTKDINVDDPNAYFLMKTKLKELKMVKFYKEIFTLIYMKGGHRPNIRNDVYEQCVHDFEVIMQKFLETRKEYHRHSMPSNYMLLDILLKQNGHESFYNFPYLKNDKCRDRVMEIYSDLKGKVSCNFKKRIIDGDNQRHS